MNGIHDKTEIEIQIIKILEQNLNINVDKIEDIENVVLTSSIVGMTGLDLYRLLLLIENYYNIKINYEDVKKYGFKTIKQIANIVYF